MIKLGILNPNTFVQTLSSLKKTGRLLTAEDVCREGSIGSRILAEAEKEHVELKAVSLIDLGDGIVPHGSLSDLKAAYHLDAGSIAEKVREMMTEEHGKDQT